MRPLPLVVLALLVPVAAQALPLTGGIRYVDVVEFDFVDRASGNEITVIPVGTKVVWVFSAANIHHHSVRSEHTATLGGYNALNFNSGPKPGYFTQTFEYTFTTAAVVAYDCYFHATMTGYIVVRP